MWKRPQIGLIATQVLFLAVAACRGTEDEGAKPGGTERPADGWVLEEELRLGTIDEGGPEEFSQIAGIKTDYSGRIFVLDFPSQEIRVFNPDGTYSHTIGSRGEGPGEFMGAAGMNFDHEGRLWVWDPTNLRFSVFNQEGEFITSHRRLARGVIYPWRGEFDPDGHMIDWGLDYPGFNPGTPGSVAPTEAYYYPVRLASDFESQDTLPPLHLEFDLSSNQQTRKPFAGKLSTYQDRTGSIWFAYSLEYEIIQRTLDGDTVQRFGIPYEPARVSRREIDSIISGGVDRPAELRFTVDDIPETKPVIHRIFGDNRGHIFVIPELEGHLAGSIVDVFSDSGVYMGRMEFPTRIRLPYPPPHATSEHLYVVIADEYDVEYVVRLRIRRE